jgi:ABC-type sugar transport system ATPase subunit
VRAGEVVGMAGIVGAERSWHALSLAWILWIPGRCGSRAADKTWESSRGEAPGIGSATEDRQGKALCRRLGGRELESRSLERNTSVGLLNRREQRNRRER